VRQINLHVANGEVVALLGPNGAGKSSTLRAIMGLVRPSGGQLSFDGKSLEGKKPEDVISMGLVMTPEGRHIFETLTVRENLVVGAITRKDRATVSQDLERMVSMFPILGERIDGLAGNLSGGEQQQLAIARSLMASPKMLLLDEPSLGLAPRLVDQVFEFLAELKSLGMPMLVVEQNATRALQLADRAYLMASGRIVMSDQAQKLLDSADVVGTYLGRKSG